MRPRGRRRGRSTWRCPARRRGARLRAAHRLFNEPQQGQPCAAVEVCRVDGVEQSAELCDAVVGVHVVTVSMRSAATCGGLTPQQDSAAVCNADTSPDPRRRPAGSRQPRTSTARQSQHGKSKATPVLADCHMQQCGAAAHLTRRAGPDWLRRNHFGDYVGQRLDR